jgi:hypothetical protein
MIMEIDDMTKFIALDYDPSRDCSMRLRIDANNKYEVAQALRRVLKVIEEGDQTDNYDEIFCIEPGNVIKVRFTLLNANTNQSYSVHLRNMRSIEQKLKKLMWDNEKCKIKAKLITNEEAKELKEELGDL